MSAQMIFLDNRIRSAVVLLPILGLTVWVASELASDEFVAPAIILTLFGVLVFFTVFMKTIRFESAILNFLLVGYLVGNRGFAEITVARPFFPGEVCLALIFLCMLVRFALTRELPLLSDPLGRFILIYCGLGLLRLSLDYRTYGMDAIRDSAMVYYSLYFFFGRQMITRPEAREVLEKCLKFSFLALVPITLVQRFAPDLFFTSAGAMNFFFQKDDLVTTFAAAAVFVLYTRPHIFRWTWLRIGLILYYIAYIVIGITRASLAGLVAGSVLLLIAGHKQILLYLVIALALGLTVLTGMASTFGGSQTADPTVLLEKISSMVEFSGYQASGYESDFAELKANNNEFRRTLWQSFFDETNAASPVFGRGFGYDFLARYEDVYRKGEWLGLRSAHNFYVTLYGRMGIVGSLIFLCITWQILAGGVRAARAVRHGWLPLPALSFWSGAWAILVAAAVGVVLEGPIGAIVFWTFLGIGSGTLREAAELAHLPAGKSSRRVIRTDQPPAPGIPHPPNRAALA